MEALSQSGGIYMADYIIKNEFLEAGINNKGAELTSLVRKKDGRQYMWSGDATYWNRVSPVLFPFVGKLNGQRYRYKDNWYEGIAQHAFARDMEFALVDNKEMEIWMKLESTEETYKIYPFKFTFETGYCLEGNSLKVIWKVHNNSDGTMYFSLGAHPAFLCPGNSKEGCFINLHTDAGSIESGELTADGVLGNVVRTFPLVDGRLEAKENIFDQDALVVESSGIKKVSLEKPEGEGYLSVLFDTPLLGIWSPAKKQAPFICIEPWYGRCDRAGFEGSLEEREYGNKLETGEVFERSYTIEVEM